MSAADEEAETNTPSDLPTTPCSVVWSAGHAYVLEPNQGRSGGVGVDDRGRPQRLTSADLQRRGWSRTRRAGGAPPTLIGLAAEPRAGPDAGRLFTVHDPV